MRNRTYGGVRGRKTKVGRKLLRFPPTRLYCQKVLADSNNIHTVLVGRAAMGFPRFMIHFLQTPEAYLRDGTNMSMCS